MSKQVRLLIYGRVQGVFYRVSAKQQADILGIKGWVRNLPDGQVEVFAEGDESAVRKLITWCHLGPPGARVEKVTLTQMKTNEQHLNFVVR